MPEINMLGVKQAAPPPFAAPPLPDPAQDLPVVPAPSIDLDLERYRDKLRRDLESVDKHSPTLKIPPSGYISYLTYVARTIVQNALDRNVQLNSTKHAFYCDQVYRSLHMMYPLLNPALNVIEEAVQKAKEISRMDSQEMSIEEKTSGFERAIVKQFHSLLSLEFHGTEVDGRNINQELVADCNAKLIRRVEFRKKRVSEWGTLPRKEMVVVVSGLE